MRKVMALADPLQDDIFVLVPFNGPQLEQYVHNLAVLFREHDAATFKSYLVRIRDAPAKQPWTTLQERLPELTALVDAK
jgi:hypothetical protein